MHESSEIKISEVNPGEDPLPLAAKLISEIDHLYLPTMKGTVNEIREQLDNSREVPVSAKSFLHDVLNNTDPNHKYWRLDLTMHAHQGGSNGGWTVSKM